jgi:hypothetical protein
MIICKKTTSAALPKNFPPGTSSASTTRTTN